MFGISNSTVDPKVMRSTDGEMEIKLDEYSKLCMKDDANSIYFAARILAAIDCERNEEEIFKELYAEYGS